MKYPARSTTRPGRVNLPVNPRELQARTAIQAPAFRSGRFPSGIAVFQHGFFPTVMRLINPINATFLTNQLFLVVNGILQLKKCKQSRRKRDSVDQFIPKPNSNLAIMPPTERTSISLDLSITLRAGYDNNPALQVVQGQRQLSIIRFMSAHDHR